MHQYLIIHGGIWHPKRIPQTGKAGFGFYIGCSAGMMKKSGKLKVDTKNVAQAELHCIANALYALKHSKFVPITKVWLWCDNQASVDNITGNSRGFKNPELRKVIDEIHFLMMEICLREGKSIRAIDTMFEVSHIKGHTGNADKLSVIQKWCDVNARKCTKQTVKPTKKR